MISRVCEFADYGKNDGGLVWNYENSGKPDAKTGNPDEILISDNYWGQSDNSHKFSPKSGCL
jgi:hypothetical protein